MYADKDPMTEKTPNALNSIPRKIVIKCILRTHIKITPKIKMKKLKSSINFTDVITHYRISRDWAEPSPVLNKTYNVKC